MLRSLAHKCTAGRCVNIAIAGHQGASDSAVGGLAGGYDVVLDAMFGFGFKGGPRPPFDTILHDLARGTTPVVSVDVPSGWSVSAEWKPLPSRIFCIVCLLLGKECRRYF